MSPVTSRKSSRGGKLRTVASLTLAALLALWTGTGAAQTSSTTSGPIPPALITTPGQLKPVDSTLKVREGDKFPDFDQPAANGGRVRLADYLGKKNVVVSFVPAAWTPVCSGQWPGYNLAKDVFDRADAVLVGISVDNVPTLHAWTTRMGGLWFPVASDFWPHGGLASALGVLRSDGVSERALFVVDKTGVIRFIEVHDINTLPDLARLAQALSALERCDCQ